MKELENYIIYEDGNIFSKRKKRFLNFSKNKDGYFITCYEGKTERVHRIIAKTFIPNPENKPCINHKDGNKLNNKVENLEWVTNSENTKHAFNTGLIKIKKGRKNPLSKDIFIFEKETKKMIKKVKGISEVMEFSGYTKSTIAYQLSKKILFLKKTKTNFFFSYNEYVEIKEQEGERITLFNLETKEEKTFNSKRSGARFFNLPKSTFEYFLKEDKLINNVWKKKQ